MISSSVGFLFNLPSLTMVKTPPSTVPPFIFYCSSIPIYTYIKASVRLHSLSPFFFFFFLQFVLACTVSVSHLVFGTERTVYYWSTFCLFTLFLHLLQPLKGLKELMLIKFIYPILIYSNAFLFVLNNISFSFFFP